MNKLQVNKNGWKDDIIVYLGESDKGKYCKIIMEIDGKEITLYANENKFKTPGDNKPDYKKSRKVEDVQQKIAATIPKYEDKTPCNEEDVRF